MKILHIDSSCGLNPSVSRLASREVVDRLVQRTSGTVTYRDIGSNPIPHIDNSYVQAFYAKSDLSAEAIASGQRSERLIQELFDHDILVLGVPMYNFGIPSTLKAYFDHIIRPGFTFRFTDQGSEGLVKNKKCITVASRSGHFPANDGNHQDIYIKNVLSFIGIVDQKFEILEGLFDRAVRQNIINNIAETVEFT